MRKVNTSFIDTRSRELTFILENVRNGAAFRCIEAIGQAISYGMNTQTESDPLTGLYVALFASYLICMTWLTDQTAALLLPCSELPLFR